MNRSKSILLAATALATLGAPQVAHAQNVPTGVAFLSGPATPAANGEIGPDSFILPKAISADGTIVLAQPIPAGNVGTPVNNNIWIWSNGTPRLIAVGRPTLPGVEEARQFTPTDLSGDGRTITGAINARATLLNGTTLRTYNLQRSAYWTQAAGLILFPQLSASEFVGRLGTAESAFVNSDGSFFAVTSSPIPYLADGSPNPASRVSRAHRYSPTGGYQSLGSLGPNISMSVSGISGAGNVIIGYSEDIAASNINADGQFINVGAFRWDTSSGLTQLPVLSAAPQNGAVGSSARANGISRDGATIVGSSRGSDGRDQAVYWRAGGIQSLGFLPGLAAPVPATGVIGTTGATTASAASANGAVIVGSAFTGSGSLAWRWDATSGMQNLNVLAQNAALNLNGFVLADAVGVSDNGQAITGNATKGPFDQFGLPAAQLGYVLSIAAAPPPDPLTLTFLAAPAGSTVADTRVVDISANGRTVAGGYALTGLILWNNGAPTDIATTGTLFGRPFVTAEVSGNGQVVTGEEFSGTRLAFVYRPGSGMQYLPDPAANEVAILSPSVNDDGTFLAVTSNVNDGRFQDCTRSYICGLINRVYRYSPTGGYENLGTFGSTWTMNTTAISGDGTVIAGSAFNTANAGSESSTAFRWTQGGGLLALPALAAPAGQAAFAVTQGISRDGSVIVGRSRGADGQFQAVYWRASAITALGFLPGTAPGQGQTEALATNANGSVIVGKAIGTTNDLAWRWTAANGMQDLNLFATNAGINLGGYVLTDAVGLSDDGQYIAGNSFNAGLDAYRGYVLSIAAAPPPTTTLSTTARLIVTLTLPGVTQTSIVNQTFSTQVDGLLNGRNVFTRTVADQITGALGVTALADARSALQVGGGLRRLVIGAPVLISNTTTVLNSTSNTVNVASGTQQTTAAVVTNGPATVATGDLGTCATAATNGVNPTGCSLPGTPVTVNTNVINTNTFTNTINSVTPTTTTTVNQLVSAKWQVSATAGNQFGTVHALVGPVAFERGDRLIGQLIDLGGTGGAAPVARAAVGGSGLTMFGGYFGNWASIDADARVPAASVRGNTDGFVLGLEKALGDAHIGVAVDHGTSSYDVRDATYPETLSMKHTQLGLFANWQSGGFALDGAAAYGFGTVRTTLTTPTTPATASRDVRSWSLGAQAGYGFQIDATTIRLIAGVRHVSAKLNAFTETGGPTPLIGIAKTVARTRLYGGVEVATRLNLGGITLTPRVHARAASDSGDASGTADLVFASAPNGPVMQAVGPGVGRTVAELGGSLDAAVGGNVHLWAGYDGTFRSGARSHAAKAGLTVNW